MAKLGTPKHPALVHTQTEARANELLKLCNDNGWNTIIRYEPNKPENISDIEILRARAIVTAPTSDRIRPASGNDFCPCKSGNKFKKCCGILSMV